MILLVWLIHFPFYLKVFSMVAVIFLLNVSIGENVKINIPSKNINGPAIIHIILNIINLPSFLK